MWQNGRKSLIPALVAVMLLGAGLWPAGASGGEAGAEARISVTGSGRAEAPPDMALIRLGVVTTGRSAAAALKENSERVSAMLAALHAAGIEARDLQTSGLSLSPRFDNRASSVPREAPRITGYEAQNMITVRVRDLAVLGAILDRVVETGANSFSGLQFTRADLRPLQEEARREAVRDAIAKARLMAGEAGMRLGPVLSISEAGGGGVPRPEMMRSAAIAGDVPVAGGEISVRAAVSMEFALLPGE